MNYSNPNNHSSRSRQGSFRGRSGPNRQVQASRIIKTFNPAGMVTSSSQLEVEAPIQIKNTFSDFHLHPGIMKNISAKNFINPTPIQDQSIPVILLGRDLIGLANTGTGKTAAFLLPLIHKSLTMSDQKTLIVAPTRELAYQIRTELMEFTRGLGIYSVLCIGGVDPYRQQRELSRQHHFVIGTPGRLCDLADAKYLKLSLYNNVILDEADHMLDIGFIKDIKYLISGLNPVRQSLFFSATIDHKIREILSGFVKDPVSVSVRRGQTAANITQEIVKVNNNARKVDTLHELLIKKEFEKVLIFGRTKHGVQHLSDELQKRGFKADAIHGNKNQNQRLRTLDRFKRNEITILLATDVAARGLDIPNVTHVINYELPESQDSYIHRIGRTGRADKRGVAITFN